MTALSSDVMAASLEIYGAMKLSRRTILGMDVLLSDMGSFFKRTRHRTAEPSIAQRQVSSLGPRFTTGCGLFRFPAKNDAESKRNGGET